MISDSFLMADCGPCFMLVVIIIIIVSVLSKGKKGGPDLMGGPGVTGKPLGNELQDLKNAFGGLAGTSGTSQFGSTGGAYVPPVKPQKPPINWNMIKLNMTKEQIRYCFDLNALNRGVKKEELPKYVYLDRLRKHFSEPQLQDMLDMDFFEKSTVKPQKASKAKGGGAKSPVVSEKLKSTTVEAKIKDITVLEQIGDKTVDEIMEEQKVMEDIKHYALYDSTFKKLVDKLSPEEKKALACSFRNVETSCGGASMDGSKIVQGIIWSEILKRPSQGPGSRGILSRR